MKFSFEATFLAKLNVVSRRSFEETYDEQEIREWCEAQGIIEDGRELSEFALEKYGMQMASAYFENAIADGSHETDRIGYDIQDEIRQYPAEITVEKITSKNLSRVSKGQLSIAA